MQLWTSLGMKGMSLHPHLENVGVKGVHCKNVWVVSTHLWLSELQSPIDVSNSGKQKQVEITQTFLQCRRCQSERG